MRKKIHITQDEYGFWMMSLEEPDGSLTLLAHHFVKPDHLVEQAHEMGAELRMGVAAADAFLESNAGTEIEVVADAPRTSVPADPSQWPAAYQPPAPRKAGE